MKKLIILLLLAGCQSQKPVQPPLPVPKVKPAPHPLAAPMPQAAKIDKNIKLDYGVPDPQNYQWTLQTSVDKTNWFNLQTFAIAPLSNYWFGVHTSNSPVRFWRMQGVRIVTP